MFAIACNCVRVCVYVGMRLYVCVRECVCACTAIAGACLPAANARTACFQICCAVELMQLDGAHSSVVLDRYRGSCLRPGDAATLCYDML